MPKKVGQKLKILKLKEFFEQETDEKNPVTTDHLKNFLDCERKSIYSDIRELTDYGFEIIKEKRDRNTYYYHDEKLFEPSELKLLTDAVLSSKMISVSMSRRLIDKLKKLTGPSNRSMLSRQLYTDKNKPAVTNELMNTIDIIQEAISNGLCINFKYYKWSVNKKQVEKHPGKVYDVSPETLVWVEEKYYLIAFDNDDNKIKHFRVDKMQRTTVNSTKKAVSCFASRDDIPKYVGKHFNMFGSDEEAQVTLLCRKDYMENVLIDRFGSDITMKSKNDTQFVAYVRVFPSKTFLSWLISLGDDVEIIDPPDLRNEMRVLAENILNRYK